MEKREKEVPLYQAPHLEAWGRIEQITAVGNTRPGGDARQGSVIPAACDINPNLPPCP